MLTSAMDDFDIMLHEAAGISEAEARATGENIPPALLGWVAGCTVIWSSLFTVGSYLYGRMDYAMALFAIFVVSDLALIWVINRLWSGAQAMSETEADVASVPCQTRRWPTEPFPRNRHDC